MTENKNKKKKGFAVVVGSALVLAGSSAIAGTILAINSQESNQRQKSYDDKKNELRELISKITDTETRNKLTEKLNTISQDYNPESLKDILELIEEAKNNHKKEIQETEKQGQMFLISDINEIKYNDKKDQKIIEAYQKKYTAIKQKFLDSINQSDITPDQLETAKNTYLNDLNNLKEEVKTTNDSLVLLTKVTDKEKESELLLQIQTSASLDLPKIQETKKNIENQIKTEKDEFVTNLSTSSSILSEVKRDILNSYDQKINDLKNQINQLNTQENINNLTLQNREKSQKVLEETQKLKQIADIIFHLKDRNPDDKKVIVDALNKVDFSNNSSNTDDTTSTDDSSNNTQTTINDVLALAQKLNNKQTVKQNDKISAVNKKLLDAVINDKKQEEFKQRLEQATNIPDSYNLDNKANLLTLLINNDSIDNDTKSQLTPLLDKLTQARELIQNNPTQASQKLTEIENQINATILGQNPDETKNNTFLNLQKNALTELINNTNLTPEQKTDLINKITSANDLTSLNNLKEQDVKKALDDQYLQDNAPRISEILNNLNNDLETEITKQSGIPGLVYVKKQNLIDSINDSNLPQSQKDVLLNKIQSAANNDPSAELTQLRTLDDEVEVFVRLQNLKDKGIELLNKLTDSPEKTNLLNSLNNLDITDLASAEQVINQAETQLNTITTNVNQQLQTTRETTQNAIDKLAGNSDLVRELSEQLSNSTTQDQFTVLKIRAEQVLNDEISATQRVIDQINDLDPKKAELQKQLDDAKNSPDSTYETFANIHNQANANLARQNELTSANSILTSASNLTEEERTELQNQLNSANDADSVALIKDQIVLKKEYSDTKAQATSSVSQITNPTKRAEFEQMLSNASTKEAADKIRSDASAYAAAEEINNDLHNRLNSLLENITDQSKKQEIATQLTNALNDDSNNPNTDQSAVLTKLHEVETKINEQLNRETELSAIKTQKEQSIETELTEIADPTKKAEFQAKLDEIKNTTDLSQAVSKANELQNMIQTQKEFESSKQLATSELSRLRVANSSQRTELENRLNAATTKEQLDNLRTEILAEKVKEDKLIEDERKKVREAISLLSDSNPLKQQLTERLQTALPIDNPDSQDDVADVEQAKSIAQEATQVFETLKTNFETELAKLTGLEDSEAIEGYNLSTFNANKSQANLDEDKLAVLSEKVQQTLQKFRDQALAEAVKLSDDNPKKAELLNAINNPDKTLAELKRLKTDSISAKQLEDAKNQALQEIQKIKSQTRREELINELNAADTVEKANEVKQKATYEIQAEQERHRLVYISALELINNIEDQQIKMDLLKQINGVDEQGNANTTGPDSSLSTQDLEDIKAVAQSQRTQEENNLEKSKESAREELLKITDTNIQDGKGDFGRRIDNARTQAEVQTIISEINAQLENAKNKALELKDKLEPNNLARLDIEALINQFGQDNTPSQAEWDALKTKAEQEIQRLRNQAISVVNRLSNGVTKSELLQNLNDQVNTDTEAKIANYQQQAQQIIDVKLAEVQAIVNKTLGSSENANFVQRLNNQNITIDELQALQNEAQTLFDNKLNEIKANIDTLLAFAKPEDDSAVNELKERLLNASNIQEINEIQNQVLAKTQELVNKELTRLLGVEGDPSKNHPQLQSLIDKVNSDTTVSVTDKINVVSETTALLSQARTQTQNSINKLNGDTEVQAQSLPLPPKAHQTYAQLLAAQEKAEELFENEKQKVLTQINALRTENQGTLSEELQNATDLNAVKSVKNKTEIAQAKQDTNDIIALIQTPDKQNAAREALTNAGDDLTAILNAKNTAIEKLREEGEEVRADVASIQNELRPYFENLNLEQSLLDNLANATTPEQLTQAKQGIINSINQIALNTISPLPDADQNKTNVTNMPNTNITEVLAKYNESLKQLAKYNAQTEINKLPENARTSLNNELTNANTTETYNEIQAKATELVNLHNLANQELASLPSQGNKTALQEELNNATTKEKTQEVIDKIAELLTKINEAQTELDKVSDRNKGNLQEELNNATTKEKVAEVLTKIQQAQRQDVLDAEYAQAQTEAQNAINNLPEGSRTTLQSRLDNTNPTPTKEQVIQIKNDAIELKTVQDQTRDTINATSLSPNNKEKLLADLNSIQTKDEITNINTRKDNILAKIQEINNKINNFRQPVGRENRTDGEYGKTDWYAEIQTRYFAEIEKLKQSINEQVANLKEADENNPLSTFETQLALVTKKHEYINRLIDKFGAGHPGFIKKLINTNDIAELDADINTNMQSIQNAQNSFWNNASLIGIRDRSSRQWIPGEPIFTAPTYRHLLADIWEISDVTEFNNFVQNKLPLYLENIRFRETITHSDANMVPQTGKDYYTQLMLNKTTTEGIVGVKEEFNTYKTETNRFTNIVNKSLTSNPNRKESLLLEINSTSNTAELETIIARNIDLLRDELKDIANSLVHFNDAKTRYNNIADTENDFRRLYDELRIASTVQEYELEGKRLLDEYIKYYPSKQTEQQQLTEKFNSIVSIETLNEYKTLYDQTRYRQDFRFFTGGNRPRVTRNGNHSKMNLPFDRVSNREETILVIAEEVDTKTEKTYSGRYSFRTVSNYTGNWSGLTSGKTYRVIRIVVGTGDKEDKEIKIPEPIEWTHP
ncbi:hypothetical protein O7983_000354 [Mycoplasmopsis felis]|uniref:hypothetical protein n=1 Tax=Mycoplasmopsis felis TaxID=33923 RepID=UPI003A4E481B